MIPFASTIGRDNLVATQFHPEKSGEVGLTPDREFFGGGLMLEKRVIVCLGCQGREDHQRV
jgi:hypothetical protein